MSLSSANPAGDPPSRRGFLVAAAGGAAALPVICSGRASATGPPRELPVVTFPEHPGAEFGSGRSGEPLNASVACGLPRGGA
ncbi:hypothetical protein [Streptomyces specialis]|uniref:hypothetical protein n=1 Tax=Streptomyces specialis TaxID=498367 RepID=UPI000A49798B|nr:hypothetical protein [Streptomyces specialis]